MIQYLRISIYNILAMQTGIKKLYNKVYLPKPGHQCIKDYCVERLLLLLYIERVNKNAIVTRYIYIYGT